MRRPHGHPVLGAISGFFFGISLALLLATFGHVALNSTILGILPIAFLLLGVLWGLWAPLGKRPPSAFAPAPKAAPVTTVAPVATAAPDTSAAPDAEGTTVVPDSLAAPVATAAPDTSAAADTEPATVVPDSLAAPPVVDAPAEAESSGESADEGGGGTGAV